MANRLNRIAVLFVVYLFAALVLSASPASIAKPATSASNMSIYIVHWNTQKQDPRLYSWLVGADNKRRWIKYEGIRKCLIDLKVPIMELGSEQIAEMEKVDNVTATCGLRKMTRNMALEKGCYLYNGVFNFTLTEDGLVLLNNSAPVWSDKSAVKGNQLLFKPDGNLVLYKYKNDKNSEPEIAWSSGTSGKNITLLALGEDGIVRLLNDKKKEMWRIP